MGRIGIFVYLFLGLISLSGCIRGSIHEASLAAPVVKNTVETLITNDDGLNISGKCKAGLDVVITGQDLNPVTVVCDSFGEFSAQLSFTGSEGTKSVQVTQTDQYGNVGKSSVSVTYDVTPPAESPVLQGWSGGDSNDNSVREITLGIADPQVSSYKSLITSGNCSSELANLQASSGLL